MLETRLATRDDYERVLALYDASINWMAGTPLDIEWRWDHHPTRERLLADIDEQTMLVSLEDGDVVGALVLNGSYHDEYDTTVWPSGIPMSESLVVHLLVVHPDKPRRGIGRAIMTAAADLARERGARAVRLDVFPYNVPACNLYDALGYTNVHQYVSYGGPDHDDLLLYELRL